MQAQLNKILEEAKEQLQQAASVSDVDDIRVKLLGKKGKLTEILRGMGKLSPEERKTIKHCFRKMRRDMYGLPITWACSITIRKEPDRTRHLLEVGLIS